MTISEKSTKRLDDEPPAVLIDTSTEGQSDLSTKRQDGGEVVQTNPHVYGGEIDGLTDRELLERIARNSDQILGYCFAMSQAAQGIQQMFADSPLASMFSGEGLSMSPLQLLRRNKKG